MSGINVPPALAQEQAQQRQFAMNQQLMLQQFRMAVARELQQMFLAKAIQPRKGDEPWQESDAGANACRDAVQIAQGSVQHANALMRSLGFKIQEPGE